MFGPLTVREAVNDVSGALILDGNGRIVALCTLHADAVDLAAEWNALLARKKQRAEELEIMRSRGEL